MNDLKNVDEKFWLFIISQNPIILENYGMTLWQYCIENKVAAMQYQEGVQDKFKRNINLIQKISENDGIIAYLNNNRIGGVGLVTKEFYENIDRGNGFNGKYGQRVNVNWEVTSLEGMDISEIKNILQNFPSNLNLATIHNISENDYNLLKSHLENKNYRPKHVTNRSNGILNKTIDLIINKKQIIFYGPPGTGKTYNGRELAVKFIDRKQESNKKW